MKSKISTSGTYIKEAGNISIKLKDEMGAIQYSGSHQGSIQYKDSIELLAKGKNGRDGVIGQDGAPGANGYRGNDATISSVGTNGGAGGSGGRGAPGTDGENAGNGGNIEVYVAKEDLALLQVIEKIDVSAGTPGKAGKHGKGGKGGTGGLGGASYSWQEPYTVARNETYTDNEGNTHSRVVEDTYYHLHTNPGGAKGPDGLDGEMDVYPLHPGAKGSPGKTQIHVSENNAIVASYDGYFDIRLNYLSFKSQENHGIWEPGDIITANYAVKNKSTGMPTPMEAIPLSLMNNTALTALENGEIAGSIPAGEQKDSLNHPVKFKILPPPKKVGTSAFKDNISLTVAAYNSRLKRNYTIATNSISVQYPVKFIPAQETHFTIAYGESQKICASITNISNRALGEQEGRKVYVEIVPKDKPDNRLVSNNINQLIPEKIYPTETTIKFNSDDVLGLTQTVNANLYLQPIDRNQDPILIQQQPYTVQLTPKYTKSDSGFLLVITKDTNQKTLTRWMTTLQTIAGASNISVWNTDYYHGLKLDKPLLEDCAKGTIVMLDKSYNLVQAKEISAIAEEYDISLVAVDYNPFIPKAITNLEARVKWDDPVLPHSSFEALMQQLLSEHKDSPKVVHQLPMPLQTASCFFNGISALDQAQNINQQLQKTFPNRNYHVSVIQTYSDRAIIAVRQIANKEQNKMHQVGSVDEVHHSLFPFLPFTQKLRLLTQSNNPYHNQLAREVLKDLLTEQDLLNKTESYGSFWDKLIKTYQHDFNKDLTKLHQLVACFKNLHQQGNFSASEQWSFLIIELIAKVQYHAENHSSFWSQLAHSFTIQPEEAIREHTVAACQEVLDVHSKTTAIPAKQAQLFFRLSYLLNKLKDKAQQLEDQSAKAATKAIIATMNQSLNDCSTNMSTENFEKMTWDCRDVIKNHRDILETHRGIMGVLDTFLTILLSALSPLGSIFLYPVIQEFKTNNHINSSFFKTESAKLIDEIEDSFKQFSI